MLKVTFYAKRAGEYTVFIGNKAKRDLIAIRCRGRRGKSEPRLSWFSGEGDAIDTNDFVLALGKAHDAFSQMTAGVDPPLALFEAGLYEW